MVGVLHYFSHEDIDGSYDLRSVVKRHESVVEEDRDEAVDEITQDILRGLLAQLRVVEYLV